MDDIGSLANYGLGSANNGGGTDGQEYDFPDIPLAAGEVLWVVRNASAMSVYFGDDFGSYVDEGTSGAANGNGNDAVEFFFDGAVVDVYGDPDNDDNIPWKY